MPDFKIDATVVVKAATPQAAWQAFEHMLDTTDWGASYEMQGHGREELEGGYAECQSCHRWLSQGEGGDPDLDENGICDDCNDPYSDSKLGIS